MGPAASGSGLCDIDKVFNRVINQSKSSVKKWEVLAQRKYTDYNINRKTQVIT